MDIDTISRSRSDHCENLRHKNSPSPSIISHLYSVRLYCENKCFKLCGIVLPVIVTLPPTDLPCNRSEAFFSRTLGFTIKPNTVCITFVERGERAITSTTRDTFGVVELRVFLKSEIAQTTRLATWIVGRWREGEMQKGREGERGKRWVAFIATDTKQASLVWGVWAFGVDMAAARWAGIRHHCNWYYLTSVQIAQMRSYSAHCYSQL